MNKGNTAATSHVSLPDIASNTSDAISINEVPPQETEVVKRQSNGENKGSTPKPSVSPEPSQSVTAIPEVVEAAVEQ